MYICKWCQISKYTLYTHVTVSFGGVMYFGLRGEGRRNWEGMEWLCIIWLHWNHLNLGFLDKFNFWFRYFDFDSNIWTISIAPSKIVAVTLISLSFCISWLPFLVIKRGKETKSDDYCYRKVGIVITIWSKYRKSINAIAI